MIKKLFLIIALLLPGFVIAQTLTDLEKANLKVRIDTFMNTYLSLADMKAPGETKVELSTMKKFHRLFLPEARIFDDINPEFDSVVALQPDGNPYMLVIRNAQDFKDVLIENYPYGLNITNKKIDINYDNLGNGKASATLIRSISGISIRNYHFLNEDTVRIDLVIKSEKKIAISSIFSLGYRFQCLNDKDLDGVIDEKDKCTNQKGPFAQSGCPDTEKIAAEGKKEVAEPKKEEIPTPPVEQPSPETRETPSGFIHSLELSVTAGYFFNQHKLEMPDPAGTFYNKDDDIDKTRSVAGDIKNPSLKGSFVFGGTVAYYFGSRKNFGISAGISYNKFEADYSASGTVYQFKAVDDENISFRKIITLKSNSETHEFTLLNIPVMLRYKSRLSDNWGLEFSAGPSYISAKSAIKKSASVFNIEGIYRMLDTLILPYTPNYDPANHSANDILLTEEAILETNGNPNALFANMHALSAVYDFQIGDTVSNAKTPLSRNGIGINLGIDLLYSISSHISVKGGVSGIYGILKNSTKDKEYRILENTRSPNETYNSYYNSKTTSKFISFGLNLGLIFGF